VPLDGIVECGKAYCNESMLTGESKLIYKEAGSSVYGGANLL
jgi:cation transport ATPase